MICTNTKKEIPKTQLFINKKQKSAIVVKNKANLNLKFIFLLKQNNKFIIIGKNLKIFNKNASLILILLTTVSAKNISCNKIYKHNIFYHHDLIYNYNMNFNIIIR